MFRFFLLALPAFLTRWSFLSLLLLVLNTKERADRLLLWVLNGPLPLEKKKKKRMTFIKLFLREGIIWVVLQ